MKKNKHIIGFLILHLIIYSIYNLGHPVTPQYIKDISAPVYMTGVLVGIMALAQFVFAPLWGQVSDVFGRKIAFLGPAGYAFGQIGFIFLSDPTQLSIFRFISGAFAVITTTVHYAYISDKSNTLAEKTKYLGVAALLLPIGIFFGYSIGGFLGDYIGPRQVFVVQAIASAIAATIMFFYVKSPIKEDASIDKINFNVFKQNVKTLEKYNDTALKYILLITFFNIISYQLTFSTASVILNSGFDKSSGYIGIFIATFNLSAGLASFVLQPKMFKSRTKNHDYLPKLSLGSVFCSLLAFGAAFTSPVLMWIGLMLSTILNTTFIALIQDIITKVDKGNDKGTLIGINQAIQSFGQFIGTTSGGIILSYYIFGPLIAGALMFVLTFILNQFVVNKQLHKTLK